MQKLDLSALTDYQSVVIVSSFATFTTACPLPIEVLMASITACPPLIEILLVKKLDFPALAKYLCVVIVFAVCQSLSATSFV